VLEYRQLTKLKGTYVDALPAQIDPRTGRLHTSFNQAGAATGRLSSSNPNLQNIPMRTALGREIRAAFIPREGWKLLVADYSQIELRLLAHLSDDPLLVEAFRNGEDIHTRTASEVLGVPPMLITPDARRDAQGGELRHRLRHQRIRTGAAAGHPASRGGEVHQELFRRATPRPHLHRPHHRRGPPDQRDANDVRPRAAHPDINSRNANARGFAERTAVNSPLQGTAADLIKLAMVRIDRLLTEGGYCSAMLLQVHDELVFECPPEELDAVSALVKKEMEGACALKVPLLVDIGVGDNWRDAK